MNKYQQIIDLIFQREYKAGKLVLPFSREDLAEACNDLNIARIRNLGDIPYSFRFRTQLPESITSTAPNDCEWIIVGAGTGLYEFRIAKPGKIEPRRNSKVIKIPDATPEIVKRYAPGTDEQALLARARYNRLVDIFMGLTCYSIQNHLRTTISEIGQIEVDEIYLGVNKRGTHFVLPCQAKSPGDRFGIVQVIQDKAFCAERYPEALCRSIALQFTDVDDVAMLELDVTEEDQLYRLSVVDERHYKLVPKGAISAEELTTLGRQEISA